MLLKDLHLESLQLQVALREASGWKGREPKSVALLEEILSTTTDQEFPGALIPRLTNGSIVYYAVAQIMPEWRRLRPLLKAFVGVTLTDFNGELTTLNDEDPFEKLLFNYSFAAISRFSPHGIRNLERSTIDALISMCRLVGMSKYHKREIPRTTAQVLHDFRFSLNSGDRVGAEQAIDFLRQNLRLDALNLHFLEVQCDAEFQLWERLLNRSFFSPLCHTRRPTKVTSSLVEALYNVKIAPLESIGDYSQVIEQFQRVILSEYAPLFSFCPPSPSESVAKMFLLSALSENAMGYESNPEIKRLIAYLSSTETLFIDQVTSILSPSKTEDYILLPNAELLRQLEIGRDLKSPMTPDRTRAILMSAIQVQTLEAYGIAVNCVERLSMKDREILLATPGFRGIWQDISCYGSQQGIPRNWVEWLERLPELSFTEGRACAEQAVQEWPISQHLRTTADIKVLADTLERTWNISEQRLYDALPHLVDWIRSDEQWPNANYKLLYERILELLLLGSRRSEAVLGAIVTVLDGLLSVGMDKPQYSQTLNEISSLLPEYASLRSVDWLLDLSDLIVIHPCMDQAVRSALWSQASIILNQYITRLTHAQAALAVDIAISLGMPETFLSDKQIGSTNSPKSSSSPTLLVAIYTLTENAGKRAQRVLKSLYPNLKIELAHELVSSSRLEQLARNADIFIICWTAAKHAATSLIQQKRPASKPVIFAPGGGSSSIIRMVESYFKAC